MVSKIGKRRLIEEFKNIKNHESLNYTSRPIKDKKGAINIGKWISYIKGPKDTVWEKGIFKLILEFKSDYPLSAPVCKFIPPLPHPNIYPSGLICLSILNEEEDWKPSLSIIQILEGIYNLLKDEPNVDSPANGIYTENYSSKREKYDKEAIKFSELQFNNNSSNFKTLTSIENQ